MEDNTPKPRAYVNVGIGAPFRDLAQRMAQLKNALEGTKLSLRAYLEGLIQADAAVQQSVLPDLTTFNTTLGFTQDNEPDKLPFLSLTQDDKPIGRVRVTAIIDGQDATDKTYTELAEAIEQGRDVVIEATKIAPDSE